MADSPFVGPTYPLASRPTSVQRTVNMMPVAVEPGNERAGWVFKDVPGLVLVDRTIIPPPTPAIWLLNDAVTTGGTANAQPWVLSNADMTVFAPDEAQTGVEEHYQGSVFSNMPQSTGKRYFEIEAGQIFAPSPFPMLATSMSWGLVNGAYNETGTVTAFGDLGSWSFLTMFAVDEAQYSGDDGAGSLTQMDSVGILADGVVFGFAVDIDAGKLWVSIDGVWIAGDPGTNTTPIATSMDAAPYNIAFASQRGWAEATLRTITTQFSYPIPSGFVYWAKL